MKGKSKEPAPDAPPKRDKVYVDGGGNGPVIIDGRSLIISAWGGDLMPSIDGTLLTHAAFSNPKAIYVNSVKANPSDEWQLVLGLKIGNSKVEQVTIDKNGVPVDNLDRIGGPHVHHYRYRSSQTVKITSVSLTKTDPPLQVTDPGEASIVHIEFEMS